jgi:hypothetical protein
MGREEGAAADLDQVVAVGVIWVTAVAGMGAC